MEVHVELKTKSKMFCSCPNNPDGKEPNVNICPVCLAHPGTLPAPNRTAIEWAVKIGKALECKIRELSKFDRKHYFYPDLPKGYQISQYDEPIAESGALTLAFPLGDNIREEIKIGIRRVHLEEDTAKMIHADGGDTLVDFNRAGTPLVEIVTNPDFKTALEAKTYCQELRAIMRALGVSDADMEKGQMRCEANVSMQEDGRFEIIDGEARPLGDYKLNPKVEVKNINSFRAVEKAIAFEIARQTSLLQKGESWPQHTRGWDEDLGETVAQRAKENAADYRYFPEPDIPPFRPMDIARDARLPELPREKRERFRQEYWFSRSDAKILTDDAALSAYAEAMMSELSDWLKSSPDAPGVETKGEEKPQKLGRVAGGLLVSKLLGVLSARKKTIADFRTSPENLAELISLLYTGKINAVNAQKMLEEMADSDRDLDPTHLMEERGWGQVRNDAAIARAVEEAIIKFPKQVAEYRAGKTAVLQFLIGMVMRATEGATDPKLVEEQMRQKLGSD